MGSHKWCVQQSQHPLLSSLVISKEVPCWCASGMNDVNVEEHAYSHDLDFRLPELGVDALVARLDVPDEIIRWLKVTARRAVNVHDFACFLFVRCDLFFVDVLDVLFQSGSLFLNEFDCICDLQDVALGSVEFNDVIAIGCT